jgi:hypothetical protein
MRRGVKQQPLVALLVAACVGYALGWLKLRRWGAKGGPLMKSILALATLALIALVVEEKTRQLAGEVQDTYAGAESRVRTAAADTRRAVKRQPLSALLIAGSAGLFLSWMTVRRWATRFASRVAFCHRTQRGAASCPPCCCMLWRMESF